MRIRTKLLVTYLSLILIFLGLLAFIFYTRNILLRAESDLLAMYKLKNTWNEMLLSMDSILTNWNDGKSYKTFLINEEKLTREIVSFYESSRKTSQRNNVYNSAVKFHLKGLYNVWQIAKKSLALLKINMENPVFKGEIEKVEKIPGLQNLVSYWTEQAYKTENASPSSIYAVRRVIDAIEFFPIYSTTLNRQFDILINDTNDVYTRIDKLQYIVSIGFLTIFIVVVLLYSVVISRKISKPIIDSIYRLAHFMGRSIKKIEFTHGDELLLLDEEINILISHYTHISEIARRLADGDITKPIEPLTDREIVGSALKEVAEYLHEFVLVSKWIKEGKYGSTIREKTDKDILARNFNIMSKVINEKITTLRNVFDSIQEGVLVLNSDFEVLETNTNFLKMLKLESIDQLREKGVLERFLPDVEDIVYKCQAGKKVNNLSLEMINSRGRKIPVRINASTTPSADHAEDQVMLFIRNESYKMRAKREKERLKAHATLAELKLLRAQINPHFLFNTLNTIAHLVEAEPDNAVETIEKLSDLFRYTLIATKRDFIQISEELNYINQLLDIEKLRYGDRLSVNYDLEEEIMDKKIPPMLLQPIVENAVKYGEDESGVITIGLSIKSKEDEIFFCISDNGNKLVDVGYLNTSNGTGIMNVNQRLRTLYKRELNFKKNIPNGLIVEFSIPMGE